MVIIMTDNNDNYQKEQCPGQGSGLTHEAGREPLLGFLAFLPMGLAQGL